MNEDAPPATPEQCADTSMIMPEFLTHTVEEQHLLYKKIGHPDSPINPVFKHPENRCRNYYTRIGPWDHNRVKLRVVSDENDFVSASRIELMQSNNVKRTWIATQAPHQEEEEKLDETTQTFWKMIAGLGEEGKEKCKDENDWNGDVQVVMLVPEEEIGILYFPVVEKGLEEDKGRELGVEKSEEHEAARLEAKRAKPDEPEKLRKSFYDAPEVNSAFLFDVKGSTEDSDILARIWELELHTYPSQKAKPTSGVDSVPSQTDGSVTKVTHFAFRHWKDFEAPRINDITPLVNLIRRTRSAIPVSAYNVVEDEIFLPDQIPALPPLVVHCKAGVGRTGTYIALDYLLHEMDCGAFDDCLLGISPNRNESSCLNPSSVNKETESKKNVAGDKSNIQGEKKGEGDEKTPKLRSKTEPIELDDPVVSIVCQIRQQRMLSVQGPEQFSFIYEALKQQWIERYPRIIAAKSPPPIKTDAEFSDQGYGEEVAHSEDTNNEKHRNTALGEL